MPIQSEHLTVQRLIYEDVDVGHQRKNNRFVFRFFEKVNLFINSFTKKKNKNRELKWLFMNSFLRVMIVMLFFTKILLKVQRDVKVRKHLRDISFNK